MKLLLEILLGVFVTGLVLTFFANYALFLWTLLRKDRKEEDE